MTCILPVERPVYGSGRPMYHRELRTHHNSPSLKGFIVSDETSKDRRLEELGDFCHGPGESPDYAGDYFEEYFNLFDLAIDCPVGSPDSLRLFRLFWNKVQGL
jgi:hypothetical protein